MTNKTCESVVTFKKLGIMVTGFTAVCNETAFHAAVMFLLSRGYNLDGEYCDVRITSVHHGRKFRVPPGKRYTSRIDMSKAEIIHLEELLK